ncbi:MAG: hypothetical protein ACUBOA_04450 [Candidatus Loosdrechtia sp.]|uniref:hypothetical protein n=1 Tax=Candidatus Loosdrechtia sp. TaxID=3101272 RepID=UPI003A76E923|nr:MAG: hypothetical protein QY305_08175 [Candidatus Jettenia sp. AMX2]
MIFNLISFLVVIGGADALFAPNTNYFALNTRLPSLFLGIFQLLAISWMIAKLPSLSLEKRASYFNDKGFTDLVSGSRFEMTISQFRPNPVREEQANREIADNG